MPTYNLTEYSSNYSETNLWFYLKDEAKNFKQILLTTTILNFKYKVKLSWKTEANGNDGILKYATIACN